MDDGEKATGTDSETLVDRIEGEADLCRNEGASDIAALLDEAAAALQYYRAAATSNRPKYVPRRIRLDRVIRGDGPFASARAEPGDYDCEVNAQGAVSVRTHTGSLLGLRLSEFEPLAWRLNEQR